MNSGSKSLTFTQYWQKEATTNLQSTGLGIRVNAARGLSFDLQGAKALSRCVANPHTPVTSDCRPFRFFFSTVLRF